MKWPDTEVLVAADDGVYLIDETGTVSQLVAGSVAYAVDDGRGGLLFQTQRDRSGSWWGGPDVSVSDTRIWWVPKGGDRPLELLVPTPGLPLDLSLVDTTQVGGRTLVFYVRHDSTMDPEYGPHGWVDSLCVFDLDERTVSEVMRFNPWEEVWSFFTGGGLVGADVLSGGHCTYLLEEGFGSVDVPETPYLPDCWTLDGPRAFNCTLSPDGSKLACVERTRPDAEDVVTVRNTATGEMLLESSGTADALDLDDRHLLVTVDGGSKIVSLEQASHEIDVPLGGLAHLVGDVPVEVAGVVPAPTEHPEVIVFGSWGATRLSNQGAIRLLTEPVSHAESDLMGGIVFQYDAENDDSEQPVWWLHESGELMQIGSAFEGVFSVGAIRGRPTLIHGIDRPLYWSDYEVGFGATMFTDLHSGHRRLFMRDTLTEWGLAEISGAGDRIAGVTWGGGSWDVGALLFDPWGAPIEAPTSVPSRCYPCIVQPRLSPDGSRLAFVRWTLGHDATTEPGAAPAALLVVDLASGAALYDEELAPFCAPEWGYGGGGPPCHAMVRLVDFDGRHVVTWHRAGSQWFSRIADTAGELSAVTVPGTAMLMKQSDVSESISEMDAFWTSVLGSIPAVEPEHRGEATGLDQALEQANRLANDLGIEVHVLLSNDYSTLRPGYWMVYAGVFSDRESATVTCEDLGPFVDSCYPRHVATPRSLDRE